MVKSGNINVLDSGNNNRTTIYNFRTVRGDNISTISNFDQLYSRRASIAQQNNYLLNSAEMAGDIKPEYQHRNAAQKFELIKLADELTNKKDQIMADGIKKNSLEMQQP